MDVDALMDTAIKAVEAIFGRPVAYTSASGTVNITVNITADFQEAYEAQDAGGTVDVAATMPALDCRAKSLQDAGIAPRADDSVTFDVRGETRTYRVAFVTRPAPGSVVLMLGQQS